jgi:hypothetical protein
METSMKLPTLICLVLAAPATAQIVYIDNNNPTGGAGNSFPFGQGGGFTSLCVYTAAQLTAGGVCPGATLVDCALAPTTAGTYNAPQARLSFGHLANDPPIAGAWESNLTVPSVAHDLTSGAYTFPYVQNNWVSLPGVAGAGFVWNGVASIALYYTASPGTTGVFFAHQTTTNLKHSVDVFNPTNQTPISIMLTALKVRLTFTGGASYQVNQSGAALVLDGIATTHCVPAIVTRAVNVPATLTVFSTLTGAGWEIVYTSPEPMVPLGGGALLLAASSQLVNVDLTAPSLSFVNNLTFPPFPGIFAIPIALPFPAAFTAQLAVLSPTNPSGLALSGPVRLIVQ